MVLNPIDDTYLHEVVNLTTFDEIIEQLREIRMAKLNISSHTLKRLNSLYSTRGESINDFYKRVEEVRREFKNAKKEVSESDIFH